MIEKSYPEARDFPTKIKTNARDQMWKACCASKPCKRFVVPFCFAIKNCALKYRFNCIIIVQVGQLPGWHRSWPEERRFLWLYQIYYDACSHKECTRNEMKSSTFLIRRNLHDFRYKNRTHLSEWRRVVFPLRTCFGVNSANAADGQCCCLLYIQSPLWTFQAMIRRVHSNPCGCKKEKERAL